jgi:Tfp pilus assembly protein PilO
MNAKRFFYILIGALVFLSVGGGVGYVLMNNSTRAQATDLQKKLASEAVADERLAQLADLQRQYQRLQPILPKLESALPKSKKQSEIALQLQQLAAANGMTLPSVTFDSSTAPGPTSQTVKAGDLLGLTISFQLSGSYPQMINFLKSLEQLNRYTAVDTLAVTRANVAAKTLSFSITMKAYLKP